MAATSPSHRAERARASLEYLAEHAEVDQYLPIGQIWDGVRESLPFTEHESVVTAKGRPRGESDWRWSSAYLAATGWLRKHPDGTGRWALTSDGVKALADYPGDELYVEAKRRYAASRLELQSSIDEALPTSWVSSEASQRKLLEAARLWVENCLQDAGSMFSSGASVWTAPTVSALRELWDRSSRVEGKNFEENL